MNPAFGVFCSGSLGATTNNFSILCAGVVHDVIALYDIVAALYPCTGIKLHLVHMAIILDALGATLDVFVGSFAFLPERGRVAERRTMLKTILILAHNQLVGLDS